MPPSSPASLPTGATLYTFNGVPVVARPGFWAIPALLIAGMAGLARWRRPELPWPQRLGLALLVSLSALSAELGHAMAHTLSARLAGAPMDEILLPFGLARTLYKDNDVPPRVHILRSLGGPAFNLLGTLVSLVWRRLAPRGSLARDFADVSLAAHGFLFVGSFALLPAIDGGVVLKWALVEAGRTEPQADRTVRRASLGLGAALLGLGAGALLVLWRKKPGKP